MISRTEIAEHINKLKIEVARQKAASKVFERRVVELKEIDSALRAQSIFSHIRSDLPAATCPLFLSKTGLYQNL